MSLRTSIAISLVLACAPRPEAASDASSTSGPGLMDSGDETTSTTGAPTTSTSTQAPPDLAGPVKECDPWKQDCPEGQKCRPFSSDGDGAWESFECIDVVRDPDGLHEPCTVFDFDVIGDDTCDAGLVCWHVDYDTGMGRCVGMCMGDLRDPACAAPGAECFILAGGFLPLCLQVCHPLDQDCPAGDACLPELLAAGRFTCAPDISGDQGQLFTPCAGPGTCDPGLLCRDPTSAVECDLMAIGCCVPFCDTTLPDTCPGVEQECLPWFADEAPPDLENLGVCTRTPA